MRKRQENVQAEVLAVLRRQGGSLSAYDILAVLREGYPKIAPPTVYRALDALIQQGRVHRLESLNAFVTCQFDQHQHDSILSICDDCGTVDESIAPDLLRDISQFIGKSGFAPTRHVIEVHGVCPSCGTGQVPA